MEKVTEAVVNKVKLEAQDIIKEAEEKAQQEAARAWKQWEVKLEEERGKILEEAEEEAARIIAQASVKARHELSSTKADIIAKIIGRVKKQLSMISTDESHLMCLIKEALDGLGVEKSRIYVSPKDMNMVRQCLSRDKEFASRIMEVRTFDCLGGVIAEDIEEKLKIDNTYETRLEMLLPKLLPEMNKELFEASI